MVTNIYMNGEFWICIAILLVSSSSEDVVMREPRGIYVLHLVRISIFSCECQLTLVKSRTVSSWYCRIRIHNTHTARLVEQ